MTDQQLKIELDKIAHELKQLRKLAALLQSAWCYGEWKAETVNEREMEEIMREQGLWPVTMSAYTFGVERMRDNGKTLSLISPGNVGIGSSVRRGNNNPDNNMMGRNNTSTTGNTSISWVKTMSNNWNKNNKHTGVNDEEQAPYTVKTGVVTSGKTDNGTLATIEITIDIKQR